MLWVLIRIALPNNIGFYAELTKIIFQVSSNIKYASYPFSAYFFQQGCYDAAKRFIVDQSTMMLGLGFSFSVFLVSMAIFLSSLNEMVIYTSLKTDF